jgi:two-component system, chemotaxis family, chemotaxis protein CheY
MSTLASSPAPATAETTTTILIVEDTPLWQKQIEQAMQAAGYATLMANNGVEALALLKTHKPAVIVSDIEMPLMSGLEFMKVLRSMPQWQKMPIILLTTSTAKDRVVEAIRLQPVQYMLKGSFVAEQLAERVKRCLDPAKAAPAALAPAPKQPSSAFPRLLQRGEVLTGITAQAAEGKTLAGVVKQATELATASPNNPAALLEIVKHDPIFAMRALQQSNGAKRVGTVEEALRVVGIDGLLNIAKSLKSYPETSKSALAIWQHSVAVACVMHKIVPRSFEMGVGVAYAIGLLHDLPEILLRQAFPSQYEAAADFADQAGRPLRHIMPDVFSVSISDIASELLTLLKLPPLIATPLRDYAAATESTGTESGRAAPTIDRLALSLRFAEYFANALQLTSTPADAFIAPISLAECRAAYVSADSINGADIRAHAIAISKKLAGDATETPAVTPQRLKLWYARHNTYAAFDPVEEALKLFADVETHAAPPSKREHFANLDGVVVCAPATDTFGLLWCLPDRMNQTSAGGRLKILYIVPPSAGTDPKRSANDDVHTLPYPFSLTALEQSLKLIKP